MARQNVAKTNKTLMTWIIIFLGIGLIFGGIALFGPKNLSLTGDGSNNDKDVITTFCPDTGLTNFELDVFNMANETGSEGVDLSVYVFEKATGNLVATITDTTSPSDTSLDCGVEYVAKAVSTSGASGDKSVFETVAGGNSKIVDGNIEFATTKATLDLTARVEQHASLQCRGYDNNQNAFLYDSSDAIATDYETDGITFMSTTNNATKSDETIGLDIELQCKAVQSDTDYNDRGILVLLEMPTTKWDTPMVYVNGQKINEVTLEADEKDAYVDYEYAFLIPDSIVIKDGSQGFDLRVVNQLKSGISSVTADPQIDLAPRGSVLSSTGLNVIVGTAVSDASTPAQVHTLFDTAIDMT